MTEKSPFDHRPDTRLGDLLRDALTPDGQSAFVRRVLARADERHLWGQPLDGSWQVLNGWARPGVAAALVTAMVASLWLWRVAPRQEDITLEEVLRAATEAVAPSAFVVASSPPTFDHVLAEGLEGRR